MAAPSGTVWGSIAYGNSEPSRGGRIGIYVTTSSTNTETTATVEVWFWSKYGVSDNLGNALYLNDTTSGGSATTDRGGTNIQTTVSTGAGWSTSNQVKLTGKSYTFTHTRGTSAQTRYLYAKLTGVDRVNATMYANTTFTVPKLATYTISYNANGGSGAPGAQTKYYGKNITLSSAKPTRSGYTFQGWATSSGGGVAYASGASYTSNSNATLYAVWKAITYTVSYNANGGSGAPGAQTKTHGVNLTLSGTKPTRTNYTFKGWATSSSATTAAYSAGGTYTTNSNVTLYAVWSLAYTKPSITNVTVRRSNSSGTASDSGTYIYVGCNWKTSYTVSSVKIELASSSGTSTTNVSASGTSGTVSQTIGGSLSTEMAYTVRIIVTDSGGSWTVSKSVPGALFVFDALKGGKGVSFGKAAELSDHADFAFKTRHRNHGYFDNMCCLHGTSPSGATVEVINLQNANGNFVIGYGNYEAKSGNTNVYGYDVNIATSNVASGSYTFQPYRRRGNSATIAIRTSGWLTNANKNVNFFVPFAVPIVGSPTVTVASGNGFILRQNGSYTHGSGSSTYVFPSTYTASIAGFHGVVITAEFSDTTNSTNNDTIGIQWHGTITFT